MSEVIREALYVYIDTLEEAVKELKLHAEGDCIVRVENKLKCAKNMLKSWE